MNLRSDHAILSLIGLPFLFSCQNEKQSMLSPPERVIIFLVDDLGIQDLSCYGNRFHETPHIDALANHGIKFTNGYAACPVSSPSRASIMTGKYPVTVNITDFIPGRQAGIGLEEDKKLMVPEFSNHLDTTLYTLGDFASDAGLLSASIGKWHLGDKGYLPENHGFDLNVAGTRSGMPVSYYWPYQREYKDGRIRKDFPELRREGKEGDYLTDQLTDKAIDFITENHDAGFLLYFSFYNVHIPIEGKPGLVKKYRKKLDDGGEFLHRNVEYAAMVESVDQNIGRVLDALDSLGLKRNTLIIFTSDNGGLSVREGPLTPATTNYPYREGKGYIYEGGIREPFIIYWPGVIDKAYVSDHPIIGTDILPTLADLFSLPDSGYEGESLVPLIRGDSIPERALFWHYPHYSNQGGKPASAVRKGKYKLIQFLEDMNYELYDVVHDPGETTNLAEELPGIRAELSKILDSWRERNNVSMPVPNPIYKPDN